MNKPIRKWLILLVAVLSTLMYVGWGKKERSSDDLVKIASASGGLVLDASGREVNDLIKLAALSGHYGAMLYLKNCGGFETSDLVKIAATGRGHVVIEF